MNTKNNKYSDIIINCLYKYTNLNYSIDIKYRLYVYYKIYK